jgi:hypothetical protein
MPLSFWGNPHKFGKLRPLPEKNTRSSRIPAKNHPDNIFFQKYMHKGHTTLIRSLCLCTPARNIDIIWISRCMHHTHDTSNLPSAKTFETFVWESSKIILNTIMADLVHLRVALSIATIQPISLSPFRLVASDSTIKRQTARCRTAVWSFCR